MTTNSLWNAARRSLALYAVLGLFSISIGMVMGLVPQLLTNRYAGDVDCRQGNNETICQAASDEAQYGSAWSNVGTSIFALLGQPLVGALSDRKGRKPALLVSLLVSLVPAIVLVGVVDRTLSPTVYYLSSTVLGLVNTVTVAFTMIADVCTMEHRPAANGLLLAAFSVGLALGPLVPRFCSDSVTVWTSLGMLVATLLLALTTVPETLPCHDDVSSAVFFGRPWQHLGVLRTTPTLRILTTASFLSSMVFSADANLVLFYMEERLHLQRSDLSDMFLVIGGCSIVLQCLLQPLIRCLGARQLLIACLSCGLLHNILYSVSTTRSTLYLAFVCSQITKLSYPLIPGLFKGVAQGQAQGALSALQSVAYAVGPLVLEWVYGRTKQIWPGFLFLVAGALYALAALVCTWLPKEQVDDAENDAATEPLLSEATDNDESDEARLP